LLALRTAGDIPALNIPPLYQDAINRFNLLSDLRSTMIPAYAMIFGLFLTILMLALVGTLISHRRFHYGILLSRGLTAGSIYTKLMLQMALVTLTGAAIALVAIIPLARLILDDGFMDIIIDYQDLLPPGYIFDVLPLPWQLIATTIGGLYVGVVTVTILLLFQLPLHGNTSPSDLLHSNIQFKEKLDI
jgi:hypothetical protein